MNEQSIGYDNQKDSSEDFCHSILSQSTDFSLCPVSSIQDGHNSTCHWQSPASQDCKLF